MRTYTSDPNQQPHELRFCSSTDHRFAGTTEAFRVVFLHYRLEDGNLFRVLWREDLPEPTVNSEGDYLVARGVHLLRVEVLDGAPDAADPTTDERYADAAVEAIEVVASL